MSTPPTHPSPPARPVQLPESRSNLLPAPQSSWRARLARPRSLAARLGFAFGVAALVMLLLASLALYHILERALGAEDDDFLRARVHVLAVMLASPDGERDVRREEHEETAARIFLIVQRTDGTTVTHTPGSPPLAPTDGPSDARSADGRRCRVLTLHLAGPPGTSLSYRAQAAIDRGHDASILRRYRNGTALVLLLGVAGAMALGSWIARRGLFPVERMRDDIAGIHPGGLDRKIPLAGLPPELAQVGATFNALLDRLDDSFGRITRFSSDIAHELRSPLQGMRSTLEVALSRPREVAAYEDVATTCLDECVALTHLIDKLLFLARAENPHTQIQRESVAVGLELEHLGELYEAPAQESGVTLRVEPCPDLKAVVDRTLFVRAVSNLLDNALRHAFPAQPPDRAHERDADAPPDAIAVARVGDASVVAGVAAATHTAGEASRPCVTLTAQGTAAGFEVRVRDNGCGLSEDDLRIAGERFFRSDRARHRASSSTGLGLSIVAGIASLHGGRMRIESRLGEGTTVILEIPQMTKT